MCDENLHLGNRLLETYLAIWLSARQYTVFTRSLAYFIRQIPKSQFDETNPGTQIGFLFHSLMVDLTLRDM